MKKKLIVLLLLATCDKTVDTAETHLRAMGYKIVACEGNELATCAADDAQFHCAVTNVTGCKGYQRVACERYYTDRPAP